MEKNVTVEVIIDNLKDNKYYGKPLTITRRGEEIEIVEKLLQKGDTFETDYEHAKYLQDLKAVEIIKKPNKININED